ncbi:hypothetical protein [Kitasatospora sp. NPDC050543]|uniref:hypothetical protein n=1 Tax=Kitasatospora sp. NPDC050543 TaxID=3364054 RepID=UPI00378DA8D2
MPVNMLVSRRPDSTDLVLREGGGSRAWAVGVALTGVGYALLVPLVLVVPTLLVALWLALAGADGESTLAVAGGIAGAEYLIGLPFVAAYQVRRIRRVEFAPAEAPHSLRLVRAGRPERWLPIAELEQVRLEHTVVEPYPGDPRPGRATLALVLVLRGGEERLTPVAPGTDPQRLAAALEALLGVAEPAPGQRGAPVPATPDSSAPEAGGHPQGPRVELVTERVVRAKPQRGSGWTSGGSASAGSGGG